MAKKFAAHSESRPFSRMQPKKLPSAEEFLAKLPLSQRRIAEALRAVIRRAAPNARETVKTQRKLISYHAPHYFCFLFPRGNEVHVGFEWGDRISDPKKQLQGEGDFSPIRYLTFRDVSEIDSKVLQSMVRESASPTIIGSSKMRPVGQRPGTKPGGGRPQKS